VMDGTVGVDSEVDVAVRSGSSSRSPSKRLHSGTARIPELSGLRALIVDDNATNRLILRSNSGLGACTRPTPSTRCGPWNAAPRVDEGQPYDVVVLDSTCPTWTGSNSRHEDRRRPTDRGPETLHASSSGRVNRDVAALQVLRGR